MCVNKCLKHPSSLIHPAARWTSTFTSGSELTAAQTRVEWLPLRPLNWTKCWGVDQCSTERHRARRVTGSSLTSRMVLGQSSCGCQFSSFYIFHITVHIFTNLVTSSHLQSTAHTSPHVYLCTLSYFYTLSHVYTHFLHTPSYFFHTVTFSPTNRILRGGVASGFRHVTDEFEPSLYHVKGKRMTVVKELHKVSLRTGFHLTHPYSSVEGIRNGAFHLISIDCTV